MITWIPIVNGGAMPAKQDAVLIWHNGEVWTAFRSTLLVASERRNVRTTTEIWNARDRHGRRAHIAIGLASHWAEITVNPPAGR